MKIKQKEQMLIERRVRCAKGNKIFFLMTAWSFRQSVPMGEGLLSLTSFVEWYRFTRCWQEVEGGNNSPFGVKR